MPKDTSSDHDQQVGAAAPAPLPRPAPRRHLRLAGITLVALLGPLAAVALGIYLYLSGGRFVSTDNAYVKSAKIAIAADVPGRVIEVGVAENQAVKPGTVLFRIDPEPFRIALARAQAREMAVRQDIQARRAVLQQKMANLKRAQGDVDFYKQQFERQNELSRKRIVSQTSLDTAQRNLRSATDTVAVIMQDIAEARARLGSDANANVEDHPLVREARALRDQAALDLANSQVRAPLAGIVTNFELQKGEHIRAGNVVFSLVGIDEIWVQANFKETDLTHVRVGQSATITIDAYPDDKRTATVAGISPATGAEFALLPPQNATGNWVKVVQRLSVRLKLDQPLAEPRLRAGMSVVVEIDTRHRRRLSGIFASLGDWLPWLSQDLGKAR